MSFLTIQTSVTFKWPKNQQDAGIWPLTKIPTPPFVQKLLTNSTLELNHSESTENLFGLVYNLVYANFAHSSAFTNFRKLNCFILFVKTHLQTHRTRFDTKAQKTHLRFELQITRFEIQDSMSKLTNQIMSLKTCILETFKCYK